MCCCNMWVAKCVLIVLNVAFFLVGTLIFVLGILAKFHQDVLLEMFNFVPEQLMEDISTAWDIPQLLSEGADLLMVIGAFILVVGFFGCCGAIKEVKCFLWMYIAVVGVILALQVAAIILIVVRTQGAGETIQSALQKSIETNYLDSEGGLSFDDEGKLRFAIRPVKLAWDGIQVVLSCCGAVNSSDYIKSHFSGSYNFTSNGTVYPVNDAKIPLSCCSFVNKEEYEEGREEMEEQKKSQFSLPTSRLSMARNARAVVQGCLTDLDPKYVHQDGCYMTFWQLIEAYWQIFVGIIVGIMVVEAIGITCACTVLRRREQKGEPI